MPSTQPAGVHGRAFLDLESDGSYVRRTGIMRSAGLADGFKIVTTNANGKIDTTLMPDNREAGLPALVTSPVTAGDFVYMFYENGGRRAVGATAISRERPPCGFVIESYAAGETAMVFTRGMNSRVQPTGVQNTDVGKRLFLSYTTAGKVLDPLSLETLWGGGTVPIGALMVALGRLVEYTSSAMRVMFAPEPAVEMQAVTSGVA